MVKAWLVGTFNPDREIPSTRYIDIGKLGQRDGGHNSTLPL